TTTRTSHSDAASSGSAIESVPSAGNPRCPSTKPPKSERAAHPAPRRACARTGWRKPTSRSRARPLAGSPSIVTSSDAGAALPANPTSASTDRPSSVREMLPVAGRLRDGSRLPQYLTRATFTLERAVTGDPVMRGPASTPFPVSTHARARTASLVPPVAGRTAQGREEARLPLIESLGVQGVLQAQIGIVEMVAELVEQGAEERAVGDDLAALRRPHPERDAVTTGAVGGAVGAGQRARLVLRP